MKNEKPEFSAFDNGEPCCTSRCSRYSACTYKNGYNSHCIPGIRFQRDEALKLSDQKDKVIGILLENKRLGGSSHESSNLHPQSLTESEVIALIGIHSEKSHCQED